MASRFPSEFCGSLCLNIRPFKKPETQVKKILEENEAFIRDGFFIYAEGKVHVADYVEVFCPRLYIYIVADYNSSRGRKIMLSVCAPFWTFHNRITFERIELEGLNLFQSTSYVKLLLGRNRHDCQIIILAKIAN